MLFPGESKLLTLPFRSQVTFWKWFWRQRRRACVEYTLTLLFRCVCWLESSGYQHRGAVTVEEAMGYSWFFTLNLSISTPSPLPLHTHSAFTELGWKRQHIDLLWAGVCRWGTFWLSAASDTPLHMLTSILPGTDAGWGGGHPSSSPTTAMRVEAESGATELKEDITFLAARCERK